jgi:hypothetical protein
MIDEIRRSTNSNYALGNASFREEIEQALGQRAIPVVNFYFIIRICPQISNDT